MRTVLLASVLALAPGLAAAQHCTAPAEAPAGVSPLSAAPPPPGLPAPSKPVLPPEQVEATPALRALAARGAELHDLGVRHGLRGVFARAADRTSFQVFYLTPDGEGVVAGEMFDLTAADPGARRVTLDQVRGIPGVVPTVDLRHAPGPGRPETPALDAAVVGSLERTAHGLVGRDGAPRVWMFFDPLCPHSAAAMDQLRPAVAAGRVQVALVPVPLLDPTGSRPNTVAALALLGGPNGAMDATWNGVVEEVRARRPLPAAAGFSAEARAAMDANRDAAHRIGVRASPTLVWTSADGAPATHTGQGGTERILASLGR